MVGEIAIGRAANSDANGSYKKLGGKAWAPLGTFGILAGIFILSFYNVVAGWAFGYFLEIAFGDLLALNDFGSFFGGYVNDIIDFSSISGFFTSNLIFSLAFMLITAVIVSQGIAAGIEAANKIMMPGLYIILIGLIIYSLTLPNAMSGVKFYLVPDFSELRIQTVFDGLKQAFFSLSLGMGCLITYGSYLKKTDNISRSAAVISIADTLVAFLAGLMIFPLVHFLQYKLGTDNVATAGPPLIFIVLPQIFSEMGPVLGRIVGGSFFLLVCFAALTSTISLLEFPVAYFVDQKKAPRKTMVWVLAGVIFILGLPSMVSQGMVGFLNKLPFYPFIGDNKQDFLTFVADMCDISLVVGGCLMCLFISRRWKIENMHREIEVSDLGYSTSFLKKYLTFTITYVAPVLLGILSVLVILEKFFGLANLI
jgi:NSS family neurotransmitter:Na+ symporter